MKGNGLARPALSPATMVVVAAAVGMLTAGLSAVHLVLSRTPSSPMVADFLKFGLMLAIPTGALVGLFAVSVGLGLRALMRRVARWGFRVTSIIAGVGVAAASIVGLMLIGPSLGLTGLEWWPAIPCLIGGVAFSLWSESRYRRS